jgi:uncharacterized protein (DUF427 family)
MGSGVGLFSQQGPLSTGAIGRFLVPEPLPKRQSYVEPLRRRARFGGVRIADSEHVLLLFEPGRYPAADFPESDISPHPLERTDHTTQHLLVLARGRAHRMTRGVAARRPSC